MGHPIKIGEDRYKITFLIEKAYITLDLALQKIFYNFCPVSQPNEKKVGYRNLVQKSACSRFKKLARAESDKPLVLTGCSV